MTKKMHGLHDKEVLSFLNDRDIFETIVLIEESLKTVTNGAQNNHHTAQEMDTLSSTEHF